MHGKGERIEKEDVVTYLIVLSQSEECMEKVRRTSHSDTDVNYIIILLLLIQ